jgi:hypothetical protein
MPEDEYVLLFALELPDVSNDLFAIAVFRCLLSQMVPSKLFVRTIDRFSATSVNYR